MWRDLQLLFPVGLMEVDRHPPGGLLVQNCAVILADRLEKLAGGWPGRFHGLGQRGSLFHLLKPFVIFLVYALWFLFLRRVLLFWCLLCPFGG